MRILPFYVVVQPVVAVVQPVVAVVAVVVVVAKVVAKQANQRVSYNPKVVSFMNPPIALFIKAILLLVFLLLLNLPLPRQILHPLLHLSSRHLLPPKRIRKRIHVLFFVVVVIEQE